MARCRLLPGKEKRVAAGHPWIYRTEIDRVGIIPPGIWWTWCPPRGAFGEGLLQPGFHDLSADHDLSEEEPVDGIYLPADTGGGGVPAASRIWAPAG